MPIDNPIDASKQQYPETAKQDALLDVLISLAGNVVPPLGMVATLRQHFATQRLEEKVHTLLEVLGGMLNELEDKSDALNERVNRPEFAEALVTAAERALRTTRNEQIRRFAHILGNTASEENPNWNRAADFISSLSELNEHDVELLDQMSVSRLIVRPVNPRAKEDLDLYATCSKLTNLGLANVDSISRERFRYDISSLGSELLRLIRH